MLAHEKSVGRFPATGKYELYLRTKPIPPSSLAGCSRSGQAKKLLGVRSYGRPAATTALRGSTCGGDGGVIAERGHGGCFYNNQVLGTLVFSWHRSSGGLGVAGGSASLSLRASV